MTEDFALVWKRICDNQGNKFLTIRKESFEYKIEDECFIPLTAISFSNNGAVRPIKAECCLA